MPSYSVGSHGDLTRNFPGWLGWLSLQPFWLVSSPFCAGLSSECDHQSGTSILTQHAGSIMAANEYGLNEWHDGDTHDELNEKEN